MTQRRQLPELPQTWGVVLVSGTESRGRVAIVELALTRGQDLPRHRHHWEDETIYVLEGTIRVWADGTWTTATAGAGLFLPRGVDHAVLTETANARLVVVFTPAGFEGFFRELAAPGRVGLEQLVTAAARYGCEITGPMPARQRPLEEHEDGRTMRSASAAVLATPNEGCWD